ncbi:MAG: hypothetical protein RIG84_04080 [Roseovarius sp.]
MQHFVQAPRGDEQVVQLASISPVQDIAPVEEPAAEPLTDTLAAEPEAAAQETVAQEPVEEAAMDAPAPMPALEDTAVEPAEAPSVAEVPMLDASAFDKMIPVPPSAAPQPDLLPVEPVTLAALDDQPIADLPGEEPAPSFGCEIKTFAVAGAAAMVDIAVDAPCMANSQFTVHHNGMMFSASTDADGLSSLTVPALARDAVFIISFVSGDSAVAKAEVDTLEYYDRAVVQWAGTDGLEIHALEYGADYDGAGHIWAGNAAEMARAARGEGGFMTVLGEPGLLNGHMAEVYTFPSGTASIEGVIEISLEATVTNGNCGRDISAQVLQKSGLEQMRAKDLTLAMPDCEGIGDVLVLKNLFDDLKIARN